jgi:hypothetical protein
MKYLFVFALPFLISFFSIQAEASVLANSCVSLGGNGTEYASAELSSALFSLPLGLRCEDIRNIADTAMIANIGVASFIAAVKSPAIAASIAPELAALGLAPASAAVATITIVGTLGVVTIKVLMSSALEECAKMDREALKQEIINEIQDRYGASGTSQTTIQVHQ